MKKFMLCSLITTLLLVGCNDAKQLPRELVIVPDTSASIDPEARRQMFAGIENIALHLRRGDTLTIIPITGDAEADLQGRTLHYVVPSAENRQAYDVDLRKLDSQIKDDLASLQTDAIAHPDKHTDILGSIRVAIKEFSKKPTGKWLMVLSDFIQDDQQFNFRKDHRLANESDAITLGESISPAEENSPHVHVVLGRLRSKEFSALAPSRQRAINAFWGQMMSSAGVDPDGTAAMLLHSASN